MTRKTVFLLGSAALLLIPGAAQADTLQDALQAAYTGNPTLSAQRASVRVADEEVPQARAAGLPTLEGSATFQENILKGEAAVGGFFSDPDRQITAQLSANVPLITFGAVTQSVRAAEQRVEASRLGLRGTESELFTAVVGAYLDVLKGEAVVQLNTRNTQVMQFTLGETRERRQAGNRGPTDVAQAEARVALAESQLETARSELIASRENYIRLVGRPPGDLAQPPMLPSMPGDAGAAVAIALERNPDLLAALAQRRAASHDVNVAEAGRYPRLSGIAGVNQYDYLGSLQSGTGPRNGDQGTTAFVGMKLDVPLFDGGRVSSQMRQARARQEVAAEQVLSAERDVVANTRSAYATWLAANRVIGTAQRGVDANTRVLAGMRAETAAGFRPLLDRLNAEQELLNSQVTMVTARRDAYVAGFALLSAMGMAEARDLSFDGGLLYDPVVNYDRVKGRLFDWNAGPETPPEATRTADTAVQDAAVAASGQPAVPVMPPANSGN